MIQKVKGEIWALGTKWINEQWLNEMIKGHYKKSVSPMHQLVYSVHYLGAGDGCGHRAGRHGHGWVANISTGIK